MKKIIFLILLTVILTPFLVRAQTIPESGSKMDNSPKVRIILDEYRSTKKSTYSCPDGSQDCLSRRNEKTSYNEEITFNYPYSSKDNVFKIVTENYSDRFIKSYRRTQCVTSDNFNQTTEKGRSVRKCDDQEVPIFDVDISTDPAFYTYSPDFAQGGGKTTLKFRVSSVGLVYDEVQEVKENSKAYLILEGGKSDTFYRITLNVSASSILPSDRINEIVSTTDRNGWFSRPILCSKIKVNNQTVKGNCTVDLIVRGQSKTYITPTIQNVPYYSYNFDILVNGGNPYTRFPEPKHGDKIFFDGFEPAAVSIDKVPKTALNQDFVPAIPFVDLKANAFFTPLSTASDGSLYSTIGRKTTLLWTIPPTATSCTGNWTRETLDITNGIGTTIVIPRFPSTVYTISCTDASGKPVGSDSIEIRTEGYINQLPVQPTLPSILGSDGKPLPVRKSNVSNKLLTSVQISSILGLLKSFNANQNVIDNVQKSLGGTPTPTPIYTPSPTYSPIPTQTPVYTYTPSPTPVYTPSPTYSPSPIYTPSPSPTATPTSTPTPSPSASPSSSPVSENSSNTTMTASIFNSFTNFWKWIFR
ncbi:MAG: hypothetical protein NUV47_03790 [Patescibacteria group bacterium]|nr:hypothetical protein [Patescibacteria group bacterium]